MFLLKGLFVICCGLVVPDKASSNCTDSLQFGFKSGTSTTECSWLVMEVASYYLRQGTPCIVTYLDCSKAFDMCQFNLFLKNCTREIFHQ